MSERFELIIFDTYEVLFRRSPRYLEDALVEEVDAASRELVDEERMWGRLARRYRLSPHDIEAVQDGLAAKFCKNLDVWKDLPGWAARHRLMLLHGGPAGLLARWRETYNLDQLFDSAVVAARLGVTRGDPALYARLAADAGVAPDRCLLVDDERAPVEAARDAGMEAYRYGTVYGLRALLVERSSAPARHPPENSHS